MRTRSSSGPVKGSGSIRNVTEAFKAADDAEYRIELPFDAMGDGVTMDVELITPIAMDKGLRFAIREGGRTVGAGTVTEVIE